ncbi:MAG: adenylate/guanylate cyclase domain-containing protein [Alphaproteobacteria bacterium]|nr:adenylate/guanylate cyclase domain-containing protein [Alphaproteobacteria bacterium]
MPLDQGTRKGRLRRILNVGDRTERARRALRARLKARRMRVRIVTALILGFLVIAGIAAASFAWTVFGAGDATERLLLDRSRRILDAEVRVLRDRLDPVADQMAYIARLAAKGRIDITSPAAMSDVLATAVERLPQTSGAAFVGLDLTTYRARRLNGEVLFDTMSVYDVPGGYERFTKMLSEVGPTWGDIFWNPELRQPMLNVRVPVRRDDNAFLGGVIAAVTMGDLSRQVSDPELGGQDGSFILIDRKYVLAHRRLVSPSGLALDETHPLPTIENLGDPVLAAIWQPAVRSRLNPGLSGSGHIVEVNGRQWVFLYRDVVVYGGNWLVGRYFPIEVATQDLERLRWGVIGGGTALLGALLLAVIMGVRIGGSIRDLGTAAEALERLDFQTVPRVKSRLRELDDAGEALEKAHGALKWFGLYVPRRLVARLMEEGTDTLVSRRRVITVMFTDIVGFTPQAEEMDELNSAELLNQHFEMLGGAIEHEHGVIDKYIGDCVMAVWGGIRRMPDHADSACRAALEIARLIREDNARRRADGLAPIRVRIGIHSGPAVVGNIGAPGRLNYTVVGDTVNVAQRFEQLGKQHMAEAEEVIVLISGETLGMLQDRESLGVEPVFVGEQTVRGRHEPEHVYRLV